MAVFARDRGARDIGLYLTQATSSGIERVTSTLLLVPNEEHHTVNVFNERFGGC